MPIITIKNQRDVILDNKKLCFILLLQLTISAIACQKSMAGTDKFQHHFYIGGAGGYGSTTWEGLVPSIQNQNIAMSLSTPTHVTEGGGVWGVFSGYELNRYFALEVGYMHYPDAHVSFDPISLFSFMNNGLTTLNTRTETVNLMGKVMLFIPKTEIRAYSSFGAAGIHRDDAIYDHWHLSPAFGIGVNYDFTPHLMGEIGANYTAGYGEAQLNPTTVYFPFLYSLSLRLAYKF